ncbi:ABC transporter substrate-binding protein [Miniphocaeibacter massiliensis]|uniref:ABC transporter substrate-binding protein n=1 Tax=Miniphocaeibacter massiliensis TaxID=2041841 RepID=UPI000C1BC3F8|nr:ABC transporter substrate-binding protein [Miniphocaeibacter massiliensis]
MRKRNLLVAMLLLVSISLTACGGGGGDSAEKSETLTVALSGDAISLDPVASNDNQSSNAMKQMYEGLVEMDEEKDEIVPALAEDWEHPDDLTYIFKLKKGVKFHNGEELKASDVVFSLKRAIEAPNVKHLYDMIDINSVKANDDSTVEFKLKAPYAAILANLCHPGAFICNEKAVNEAGDSYQQNPVGTGPLKFVSWQKANSMEMERFEDYHGDKVQYKKLLFRIIPEATNRTIELESGGVDIAMDITPNDVSKVEGNEKLALHRSLDYGTTYLGFNTKKAPLDNPKVREAISYAIDIDEIVNAVFLGIGETATGPMPPTLKFSIADSMKPKKRDVEKAKALLKESGVELPIKTSISTNDNKDRVDMATAMKQQLSEVGIEVSINVLEWSAFNDLIKNGQQDMFEIAWTADSPDPDTFMFPCLHSSSQGEGGNYAYLEDAKMDELLEKARAAQTDEERADYYKQAQERVIELTVWVPEHFKEILIGSNKDVKNVQVSKFGSHKLTRVTKGEQK